MDRLSQGAHEEKGDAGSTVCIKANRFRPQCTAYSGQACQINNSLPLCNELLIDSGLKLRPQRGGWLNLASIPRSRMTRAEPDSYRSTPFLRWLLKTHACISSLQISDDSLTSHSRMVLRELPDDCRLRNLTLDLFPDGHTDAYLQTHLPRLRNLEALSCSTRRDCADAMAAVSALLRTTKRLKCLVLRGSFGFTQPPKMLIDALAANSTLKWFDLATYWETNMPPGPLGEYVRSNGFLTSLTVSGLDADRETLLLEEALIRNHTLSTLEVLNVCGGKRTASFITGLLTKCSKLRKFYVGWARNTYTRVSEATVTCCAEALAQNQTLEDLTLPYGLWHSINWITFFSLLPRNRYLKKLTVTTLQYAEECSTFPPVLEALALAKPLAHVSFGHYMHGMGVDLLRYSAFSSIGLCGEENVQVDALQRLPALDRFTSLTVDVSEAGERLFSALAKYVRETTVLQELKLVVTSRLAPDNTASYTCWTLLFESMSANTSVSDLDILTNGKFQYNYLLTRTIGHSEYISRVQFLENTGLGDATFFVWTLSESISHNYGLLKVDLNGANVESEVKRCLFAIRKRTQRNRDILERAAAFIKIAPLDRHTATAFEKVARNPALTRELAKKENITTAEVARMLRSHLRSVEGLHDFMRLTGVVKKSVKCVPPADDCGMQLHDLNEDSWRLVRRYLSFDDVKYFSIAIEDPSTSS
ncbi:uncharacterized protein LOC142766876 [Rhipicephalus microplus]|uniref:uncharacterized protein LOC142766876 n=1 Tax=Rhipicephalus microplus TaxID=6941 RepID=UPI003F6B9E82